MRDFCKISFCLLPMLLLIVAVGCGPGEGMTTLHGTVTIDDQVMEGVQITFDPQFEGGTQAVGVTDANGRYVAKISRNLEGIKIGEYIVRVNATIHGENETTVLAEIPPEYADESTQTVVIDAGTGSYDLNVVTK